MVKSHTVRCSRKRFQPRMPANALRAVCAGSFHLKRVRGKGPESPLHPSDRPTVEDLIWRAAQDEKKRGLAGLSFAPVYAFTAAVVHMARGQERQSIIDALPKPESGKSDEWNAGFDTAIAGVIGVLVGRSFTH
jgi:hypothetical protein